MRRGNMHEPLQGLREEDIVTPNLNNYSQGYINLTKPATVATLKDRLNLKNLTPEIDLSKRSIETFSISRLALQLTGFFDYFEYKLVQVIGRDEQEYMKRLSDDVLTERLEKITSYNVPCIIISGNLRVKEPVIEVCKRSGVPLLRSERETSDMDSEIIKILRVLLAPKETLHGVLVDVYGVGTMITGDSGIGKSEAALELVKRGHRLISDDIVEIRKVSEETLVGIAPELTRDFIVVRGIGIINVRAMFGYEAVKYSQNIDMIINLEEYVKERNYDRFGLEPKYEEIMGHKVFKIDVPVRPGRNLAVIVESAAINYRARVAGYDAPSEFMSRIQKIKIETMGRKSTELSGEED